MNLHKWKALLKKDFKLMIGNKNITFLIAMPIIFAFIYSNLFPKDPAGGVDVKYTLMALINVLGLAVIGSSILGMSIAEEKEKKTLRSLMLSDISGPQFILSKAIIILGLFVVAMVACYFIVGVPVSYLPMYLLHLFLSTLALLLLSAVIGLFAQNQQSVGILGMPVMFGVMVPIFSIMSDNKVLHTIAGFLPSGPMTYQLLQQGGVPIGGSLLQSLVIVVVWIGLAMGIFALAYKKQGVDN